MTANSGAFLSPSEAQSCPIRRLSQHDYWYFI